MLQFVVLIHTDDDKLICCNLEEAAAQIGSQLQIPSRKMANLP